MYVSKMDDRKTNKLGTAEVGATPKAKKLQTLKNMFKKFFMKNSQKSSKHPKGAFSARKML